MAISWSYFIGGECALHSGASVTPAHCYLHDVLEINNTVIINVVESIIVRSIIVVVGIGVLTRSLPSAGYFHNVHDIHAAIAVGVAVAVKVDVGVVVRVLVGVFVGVGVMVGVAVGGRRDAK